jgi:hypothetical protein
VIFFQKLIFQLCRVGAKWYFKSTYLKKEERAALLSTDGACVN